MTTTELAFEYLENMALSRQFPSDVALEREDYEDLLEQRDSDAFSSIWTKTYHAIKHQIKQVGLTAAEADRVKKIREAVFKRVYAKTQESDLASYISDDIGLLADALLVHYQDHWLNGLWNAYQANKIPSGDLIPIPGNLAGLILAG